MGSLIYPNLKDASHIAIDTETCDPNLLKLGPGGARGDRRAGRRAARRGKRGRRPCLSFAPRLRRDVICSRFAISTARTSSESSTQRALSRHLSSERSRSCRRCAEEPS